MKTGNLTTGYQIRHQSQIYPSEQVSAFGLSPYLKSDLKSISEINSLVKETNSYKTDDKLNKSEELDSSSESEVEDKPIIDLMLKMEDIRQNKMSVMQRKEL